MQSISWIWPLAMYQISSKQIVGLLLLAVFAVYANALLWGAFQFDDYNVIVNNPVVHSWHAWWADVGYGIRPLLKLSYTFDWTLGRGAFGFHLTNLLIHVGNSILIWFLTIAFLRQLGKTCPHAMLVGTVAALLFAVHPIHTEAVTYISGRSASLMTLFYLGGILCYMTGVQKQSQFYLHVAIPILFIAALAVKEAAVTFPLALLLLHRNMGGSWRNVLRDTWSSWLVLLAAMILFFQDTNYSPHLARSLDMHKGFLNLVVQTNAVLYLLGQWFCPLWLNIDPDLSHSVAISPLKLGAIIAVIAVYMVLLKRIRQRPCLNFALGWLFTHLFLIYLITPRLDIANERQLYLISWPLLMALVAETAILLSARQLIMVAMALLISASSLTIMRNFDYRSEVALWQATVKFSPNKSRAHNNLGYAYFLAGQPEMARQHYLKALALDHRNFKAKYNLQTLDNVKS